MRVRASRSGPELRPRSTFQALIGLRFGEFGSQIKAVFLCSSSMALRGFRALHVSKCGKLLHTKAGEKARLHQRVSLR